MARYTTTVSSPHPAEAVFDSLADFSTVAQWDPNVESATRMEEGELAVGSKFKVLNDFFGRKQKLVYEMLAYDRPNEFVVEAKTSSFDSNDTVTITPTSSGCDVTYDAIITMKGVGRFFDPVIGLLFRIVGGKAEKGLRDYVNRPDLVAG
ncbi:MAG: SRPBCC family protein [Actinomycetota bacterium]